MILKDAPAPSSEIVKDEQPGLLGLEAVLSGVGEQPPVRPRSSISHLELRVLAEQGSDKAHELLT